MKVNNIFHPLKWYRACEKKKRERELYEIYKRSKYFRQIEYVKFYPDSYDSSYDSPNIMFAHYIGKGKDLEIINALMGFEKYRLIVVDK